MTNYKISADTPIAALTISQFRELLGSREEERKKTAPLQSKFLSLDEVVELTGYSKHTLYKMCGRRDIPFYKASGKSKKLTFLRTEIEEWMSGRRFQTHAEFSDSNL